MVQQEVQIKGLNYISLKGKLAVHSVVLQRTLHPVQRTCVAVRLSRHSLQYQLCVVLFQETRSDYTVDQGQVCNVATNRLQCTSRSIPNSITEGSSSAVYRGVTAQGCVATFHDCLVCRELQEDGDGSGYGVTNDSVTNPNYDKNRISLPTPSRTKGTTAGTILLPRCSQCRDDRLNGMWYGIIMYV